MQYDALHRSLPKSAVRPEMLRRWVRQQERAIPVSGLARLRRRGGHQVAGARVRELRRASEILRLANAFFFQAEFGRHFKQ